MKTLAFLLIISLLHVATPAPTQRLLPFEAAMLDKLHQPWSKTTKKPEFPRKGEYLCKGGICKSKVQGCQDCQQSIPLELGNEFITG